MFASKVRQSTRATYLVGATIPCLFFGRWWIPLIPLAYWALKRVVAILPTAAAIDERRLREREGLFFLAALSGALRAGLPLLSALAYVTSLLKSSLHRDLERIYSLLVLGAEPMQAWSVLNEDPQLALLAQSIAKSQLDGRSIAGVVERAATLCYQNTVRRSRERVKSLSVKLALPVGLCFLPSFLVGGIGPIVYSFFATLRIF